MYSEYSAIFDHLNSHNIGFCLLRDELDKNCLLADLDLLIEDDKFYDAIKLLGELNYKVINTERLNPFKVVLIKYSDGEFIDLDLHRRIVFEGLIYLNHRDILRRRRKIQNYYLPSDTDLLLILLFHNVVGKRRIQEKHYPAINTLRNDFDTVYAKNTLKKFGTYEIFLNIIYQLDQIKNDNKKLNEFRNEIIKSIYWRDPIRFFAINWLKIKKLLFHYSLKRRGIVISCIGVDGAGKSSTTAALCDIFDKKYPRFIVSVVYMGLWGNYQIEVLKRFANYPEFLLTTKDFLSKFFSEDRQKDMNLFRTLFLSGKILLGKKLTKKEKKAHQIVRDNSRLYLILRYINSCVSLMLFFVLIMLEMYIRYYKIYRRLRRGQIVITDRYIYDFFIGSMHKISHSHEKTRSFMCKIFFKPNIIFLLRNEPQVIWTRKKQLSIANLETIQTIYDKLAQKYHFINVTTDHNPHILAKQLIEEKFGEICKKLII